MFNKTNTIPIAADHAGFELKEFLINKLEQAGYTLKDLGTHSTLSMDYPDVAHPLASAVNNGKYAFGILICGSGNGMAITANKYAGVRAALCWTVELASLARMHNNANILCLPARFIDKETAFEEVISFVNTEFEGGRHEARVDKITGGMIR
jgi:ribose 5-phosphate isomerase B